MPPSLTKRDCVGYDITCLRADTDPHVFTRQFLHEISGPRPAQQGLLPSHSSWALLALHAGGMQATVGVTPASGFAVRCVPKKL